MAMPYFGSSYAYTMFVENANTTFAFVFFVEAVLKITAQHGVYFQGARARAGSCVLRGSGRCLTGLVRIRGEALS